MIRKISGKTKSPSSTHLNHPVAETKLPTFIESFLADRTMQVRVGSSLSDLYDQEQGVPQGGVLSTTLFNIKINDIVKCLDNLTDCSLYVDDFCICF